MSPRGGAEDSDPSVAAAADGRPNSPNSPDSPFATEAPGDKPDDELADGLDDDELEAEAHVVEDLLDSVVAEVEADRSADQTAEEAVAEAVELARRFEAERDEYLDLVRRVQAEFENYKRRVDTQRVDQRAQAAADLVKELLPVLDACDAAVTQGHGDVEPVRVQLMQTLEKQGLFAVGEAGVAFDPNIHEAVLHEDGDGDGDIVVVEVMRPGYLWNDRVVRAAMVKVRG